MNTLFVVGIGPGGHEDMTFRADAALKNADVIVGYTAYTALVRPYYPDKRYFETGMLGEVERCREALRLAEQGERVAVVCSGDSGVYGMAGLLHELAGERPDVELCVIPGVTAALAGGALLGAPLTHDFAVISLSDLLTPWALIEARLEAAAAADLCVCLYNPASKKRADYLKKACDILLRHKAPETVCGLARNIGREGEDAVLTTLSALGESAADMFTTVFIGNSQTRSLAGRMVTPRGYPLG